MDNFQEFDNPSAKLEVTGGLKKNIAGFIDAILVIILCEVINFILLSLTIKIVEYYNMVNVHAGIFAIFILYRFITILLFTKTIGMAALNIHFAKEDGTKLSKKEKIFAVFMIYINGVNCFNFD